MAKRFTKGTDKVISGVASGLATYFDVDVTLVRVAIVVISLITSGAAAIAYIVLMFALPEYDAFKENHDNEKTFSSFDNFSSSNNSNKTSSNASKLAKDDDKEDFGI